MSTEPCTAPPCATNPGDMHFHQLAPTGVLADHVDALLAVQIDSAQALPLAVAPHDSLMLTVQFGRQAADQKAPLGHNTALSGIREHTRSFVGAGHCITLFAMLTPLGAVQLLGSRRLDHAQRVRAPLAALLDETLARRLESTVALAGDAAAQLRAFAAWLESRALACTAQPRAAMRAARAAMRLCREPNVGVERVSDEQHVSRRQLERDFGHWIGTTPRHLSQVARVQHAARAAHSGGTLASAAATAGFADQAHLSRTVRQLTGLTPRQFVRSQRTPIAAAFRAASGGRTVYL